MRRGLGKGDDRSRTALDDPALPVPIKSERQLILGGCPGPPASPPRVLARGGLGLGGGGAARLGGRLGLEPCLGLGGPHRRGLLGLRRDLLFRELLR
eukprot:scaffold11303_cov51-Phaeocystis_antarctica.AAC.1